MNTTPRIGGDLPAKVNMKTLLEQRAQLLRNGETAEHRLRLAQEADKAAATALEQFMAVYKGIVIPVLEGLLEKVIKKNRWLTVSEPVLYLQNPQAPMYFAVNEQVEGWWHVLAFKINPESDSQLHTTNDFLWTLISPSQLKLMENVFWQGDGFVYADIYINVITGESSITRRRVNDNSNA